MMAPMGHQPASASPAWRTAFVISLITCGLSFTVLAAALLTEFGDSGESASGGIVPSGVTEPSGTEEPVYFSGPLPQGLEQLGLVPAGVNEADLAFKAVWLEPGAREVRFWFDRGLLSRLSELLALFGAGWALGGLVWMAVLLRERVRDVAPAASR